MSSKQAYLASAHRQGESSVVETSETQLVPQVPKVIRESPQDAKTMAIGKMIEVPEVIAKPPQINPTSAWRMFVDGARNKIGARARMVFKSPEGTIFEHCFKLNFQQQTTKPNTRPSLWDSSPPAS